MRENFDQVWIHLKFIDFEFHAFVVPIWLPNAKMHLLRTRGEGDLLKIISQTFLDTGWLSWTTLWQVKCKWIRTYGLNFPWSVHGFVNYEKKGNGKMQF